MLKFTVGLLRVLEQKDYVDVGRELRESETWLRSTNQSEGHSLLEGFEQLLIRLGVFELLRKKLYSTNPT